MIKIIGFNEPSPPKQCHLRKRLNTIVLNRLQLEPCRQNNILRREVGGIITDQIFVHTEVLKGLANLDVHYFAADESEDSEYLMLLLWEDAK